MGRAGFEFQLSHDTPQVRHLLEARAPPNCLANQFHKVVEGINWGRKDHERRPELLGGEKPGEYSC